MHTVDAMVKHRIIATLSVIQISPDMRIIMQDMKKARTVINCFSWTTHSHIDILEDIFPKTMNGQPTHKHWINIIIIFMKLHCSFCSRK